MNKRAAQKKARETEYTWGDLKQIVQGTTRNGMSIVNPSFTKAHALEIFEGGLTNKNDAEKVQRQSYSFHSRSDYHVNTVTAANIFRECL